MPYDPKYKRGPSTKTAPVDLSDLGGPAPPKSPAGAKAKPDYAELLAALQAANAPPPPQPGIVERLGGARGLVGGLIRAGSGWAAAEGGLLGAGISGLGEAAAELTEGDIPSLARVGTEAALGAVPLGRLFKAGKFATSALRGGLYSGIGTGMREVAEGKDLDPTAMATSAGIGGLVGGGLAKMFSPAAPAEKIAAETFDKARAMRIKSGEDMMKGQMAGRSDIMTPLKEPNIAQQVSEQQRLKMGLGGPAYLSEKEAAQAEKQRLAKIAYDEARAGLVPGVAKVSKTFSAEIPGGKGSVRTPFVEKDAENAAGKAVSPTGATAEDIENNPYVQSAAHWKAATPPPTIAPEETLESLQAKLAENEAAIAASKVAPPTATAEPTVPPSAAPAPSAPESPLFKLLKINEEGGLVNTRRGAAGLNYNLAKQDAAAGKIPSAEYARAALIRENEAARTTGALPKTTVREARAASAAARKAKAAGRGASAIPPTAPPITPPEGPSSPFPGFRKVRPGEGFPPEAEYKMDMSAPSGEGAYVKIDPAIPETAEPIAAQPVTPPAPTPEGAETLAPPTPEESAAATKAGRPLGPAADQAQAAEFQTFLDRLNKLGGPIKGAAPIGALAKLLATGGGALIGAPVGAAMNPNDPTGGAIMGGMAGGALGYGAASAPEMLMRLGAHPEVAAIASGDLSNAAKVKSTAQKIGQLLPQVQRFNYLSSANGLLANAVAGPWGSAFFGSLERGLAGDARGWTAMKELWNPADFIRGMSSEYPAAEKLISRAEGSASGVGRAETTSVGGKYLAIPGNLMTSGDLHARNILMRAGFTEAEAREITLTSEPFTKSGVSASHARGFAANMLFPFKRTPVNIVEQGLLRTPFVGFGMHALRESAGREAVPAAVKLKQQLIGGGVLGTSALAGYNTSPENASTARRYISNAAGPYSLLATIGFGGGQGYKAGGISPALKAGATSGISALPIPSTQTLTDLKNFFLNGGLEKFEASHDPNDLPRAITPAMLRELTDPKNKQQLKDFLFGRP